MNTWISQYDGVSFRCYVLKNLSVAGAWNDGDFAVVVATAKKDAVVTSVAFASEVDSTVDITLITEDGVPNVTLHCDRWSLTIEMRVARAKLNTGDTTYDVYERRSGEWVKIT